MLQPIDVLIRRLHAIGKLGENDRSLLQSLKVRTEALDKGQLIIADGEAISACCLLIHGFACRSKFLADGNRQILSLHMAGEVPNLNSFHLNRMDYDLATLSRCEVGYIAHSDLQDILSESQSLTDLLRRYTLIDAAAVRTWLTMLGRAPAQTRMAHLFCELFVRAGMIGAVHNDSFSLPITQADLADCLGVSVVHTNRVLQELRSHNILEFGERVASVLDWHRLKEFAQFEPAYLHYTDRLIGR